jgi:bifunctional non-homologous end joining protein LigD
MDSTPRFDLSHAPKGMPPAYIKPMLATSVDEPFDRDGWVFEIKWDGYRAIADVSKRGVRLYSRNQLSFAERYRPLLEPLRELDQEAVLDGEIVVLDQQGRSEFQQLQNYQKTGQGAMVYYVFDLIYLDGHDLKSLPLLERKRFLHQLVHGAGLIRVSEHVEKHGIAFFQAVTAQGLEGIVAKDSSSHYWPAARSSSWLKIKGRKRQEAVIGGFTRPRRSRAHFGSLVLGVYEGDDLVYVGHSGSGFTRQSLADMHSRLQPLIQKECPFREKPPTNEPAEWVQPLLVCEVAFAEWTQDGNMRQPIFQGLREDKPARQVRREVAEPTQAVLSEASGESMKSKTPQTSPRRAPGANSGRDLQIDGQAVHVTNLGKVYWPEDGYTKGDLIEYYRTIAPIMVPYLKDRPESLHRHPNGIGAKSFFQKDAGGQAPDWIQVAPVRSDSGGKVIHYLVCQNSAALVYLANLGCIEINPWSSRLTALDRPDFLIIDLDPEDVPFDGVVQTALVVRKVLERIDAPSCCKTSGKRGMHIYVPLGARYTYPQGRQFAEIIANVVRAELPDLTSVVRSPAQRQKRVYLDFLQNAEGQTLAAPYSVRPSAGATVSTPLRWSEVKRGLDPRKYTIRTIPKRLDKVGDLWAPVLGPGIDLNRSLAALAGT